MVDIQQGGSYPPEVAGIPRMDGYSQMVEVAERIVAAARAAQLPVIFVQELHRPSGVDFGRELDGAEGVHCVEGQPGTDLWPSLRPGPDDFYIPKRRYSAFFGTELDILLRGLQVDTVVLIGGLTDVCIHYTFVDAHQRDLYARVVRDCVVGSSIPAHQASLRAMEYLQRGACIGSEELIGHLCTSTGPPPAAGVGA